MTKFYVPVLVVHVVVAVMGLGSISSIALLAATARRAGKYGAGVPVWLGPLLRYSAVCLAAMLVTGVLLDLAAGGAFRGSWWFRGSALLLAAMGVLHTQARRAFRHNRAGDDTGGVALRRVERIAYGMCALVAIITVLMEVKPF